MAAARTGACRRFCCWRRRWRSGAPRSLAGVARVDQRHGQRQLGRRAAWRDRHGHAEGHESATSAVTNEPGRSPALPAARHLRRHSRVERLQEDAARQRRGPGQRPARHRLTMEIGGLEETVTVTRAPLLETRSASQGQVIDEKRISLLPLSDGIRSSWRASPRHGLHRRPEVLAPVRQRRHDERRRRRAPGVNEFTLDGSPNMASGNRVAFVPPSDAVQEFKVESATFDAQQGHTAAPRSTSPSRAAPTTSAGRATSSTATSRCPRTSTSSRRPGSRSRRWTTRGGRHAGRPDHQEQDVLLRRLRAARRRVPRAGRVLGAHGCAAQRRLLGAPLSGHHHLRPGHGVQNAAGRVERLPFPGNVIPSNRLSPIAQNYLKYYPSPNQAGDAQGRNNYLSDRYAPTTSTRSPSAATISSARTSGSSSGTTATTAARRAANWTGEVNGVNPTGNYLFRDQQPGHDRPRVDDVVGMLLNLRGGYAEFHEPNIRQHEEVFDPATLGWSPTVVQYFQGDAVHAALRDLGRDERARAGPGEQHRARDLVVPAHVDQGGRGAQRPRGVGLPHLPGVRASRRRTPQAATTSTPTTRGSSTTRRTPPPGSSWPRCCSGSRRAGSSLATPIATTRRATRASSSRTTGASTAS